MTTYYVRTPANGGSDAAAGTSAGAAWATIDKAANTVAAADTVYVGAGIYRELVTMDTSGSSGNQISYIADVDGSQTGDAGQVIISAYTTDIDISDQLAACWNMNGKEFITVRGFNMIGDYGIYDNQLAGDRAYEGVIIEDCVLQGRSYGLYLDLNAGASPAANGLIVRRCNVSVMVVRFDTNASANVNAKILIENVNCFCFLSSAATTGLQILGTGASSFSIGGVTIANCVVFGEDIALQAMKDTTNVSNVVNCASSGTSAVVTASSSTAGAVVAYNCAPLAAASATYTGATEGNQFTQLRPTQPMLGGISDLPLYRFLGWSPYKPFEPYSKGDYANPLQAFGQNTVHLPTEDLYNNPRGLGLPQYGEFYYFDASDAAATDPNNVWTSEASVFDTSITTSGFSSTVGSASSNYVMAEGTNAPASGDNILAVYVRPRAYRAVASSTMGIEVFTDGLGESLGSLTFSIGASVLSYSDWQVLSTPTGGWTWAKLQALEVKAWALGSATATNVYGIQLAVVTDGGHSDIGAVESRSRPQQESTTKRTDTFSARFEGAGYYDCWRPVAASATTISVYGRFDSNYSGSKPKIEVMEIPGVADQSDTMTGSANTWEQISCTFTPTSAGWVRVRLSSQDVSTTGQCFFDDLDVA